MSPQDIYQLNEEVALALGYMLVRRENGIAQVSKDGRQFLCCPYNPNRAIPRDAYFSPATDLALAMQLFSEYPFFRLEKLPDGAQVFLRVSQEPCYLISKKASSIQEAVCRTLIAAADAGVI